MRIKRSRDFKRWKVEHNRILFYIILVLIALLIFIVFQIRHLNVEKNANNALNNTGDNVGMANPASVYCINQSGKLDIRSDEQGNQYGVCVFDDGSECEEWKYFRGECGMGESLNISTSNSCSLDNDCVKVQTTCCSCRMGGKETCVPKSESRDYEEKLLECPEGIMCIALYNCKPTKCSCIDGECVEI
jgi:putative hemolysin